MLVAGGSCRERIGRVGRTCVGVWVVVSVMGV